MRPRRTAGAAELRGAEQRQRRHVTARMRSTTVRVRSPDLLARIFGRPRGLKSALHVAFGLVPLFRKRGKKPITKGNAHRREYKFCTSTRVNSILTILHSTVLSDTTSAALLSCRGKAPPPPPFDGGDDDLSINIQTQVGRHPYRRAPHPPRARRRAAHPGSSRSAELPPPLGVVRLLRAALGAMALRAPAAALAAFRYLCSTVDVRFTARACSPAAHLGRYEAPPPRPSRPTSLPLPN